MVVAAVHGTHLPSHPAISICGTCFCSTACCLLPVLFVHVSSTAITASCCLDLSPSSCPFAFVLSETAVIQRGRKNVGPLCRIPSTLGKNILHACPELVRQLPFEVLDCCAHDMWGAGYLMHTAFTNLSPWSFAAVGDEHAKCKTMCRFHEGWVSPCLPLSLS